MAKFGGAEREGVTAAHEDYLRAIYLLLQQDEKATNSAISAYLGVAPASATNMIKRLAALGLVTHTPYQGVELTEAGAHVALLVVRYHRLLELYLTRALAMPWDQVHAEADRLEHVISENLADALARTLGEPTADPHGDPIPTRSGSLPGTSHRRLSEQPVGLTVNLVRVGTQVAETLRYLGERGLYPGARLTVQGRTPDGDLVIGVAGKRHTLAVGVARQLYVEPVD